MIIMCELIKIIHNFPLKKFNFMQIVEINFQFFKVNAELRHKIDFKI